MTLLPKKELILPCIPGFPGKLEFKYRRWASWPIFCSHPKNNRIVIKLTCPVCWLCTRHDKFFVLNFSSIFKTALGGGSFSILR